MRRSNNPKKFFTQAEQKRIVAAIAAAEERTSAEVRVHVERKCRREPPLERAKEIFCHLGMEKTEQKNGVLIYLATASRRFAILGDEGIDKLVPDDFWEDIRNIMTARFRDGAFCEGIEEGIARVGEKLREFFPLQEEDKNELRDELSFGDEAQNRPPDLN